MKLRLQVAGDLLKATHVGPDLHISQVVLFIPQAGRLVLIAESSAEALNSEVVSGGTRKGGLPDMNDYFVFFT